MPAFLSRIFIPYSCINIQYLDKSFNRSRNFQQPLFAF
ncbi:hypothetical protein TREAZ_0977 [Leadbettera azotonutricia ZAS-9]|uniref:Uncharacterized protein n=1 Tax=Leadbettera azotonutricia (strain ATCC BAA-888 / DSM 13862 / ZAS-9) TaxID=545695 RepID=F5Y8A5_LEAAZ|nr:hypothetical protein TREAZ_0977 [Leadbettera azotonutricia ZAS-9]